MTIVLWIAGAVVLLLLLYLVSVKGNRDKNAVKPFFIYRFAHRGLHNHVIPENSMTAFEKAVQNGYGAELDVHLTADGHLAVFHDNTLTRMAKADSRVCDLTRADLKEIHLAGTMETIPMLDEVLPLFDNNPPLIVELKTDRGNAAELCEKTCAMLDRYNGLYAVESFDPRCLMWLKKHRPDIVRGQLSQNFFKTKDVSFPLRVVLTSLCLNLLTKPHFIAYNFEHKNDVPFRLAKSFWKTPVIYWTLRSKEDILAAEKDSGAAIFEDQKKEVTVHGNDLG